MRCRPELGLRRQIFFCQLGGFDTHQNQVNTQSTLLAQISQAIKAFHDATIELGLERQVTTFTLSDFGRTLQPAGSGAVVGSDHAWGSHHLVVGGAVQRRRLLRRGRSKRHGVSGAAAERAERY